MATLGRVKVRPAAYAAVEATNPELAQALRDAPGVAAVTTLRVGTSRIAGVDVQVVGIDPTTYPQVSGLQFTAGDLLVTNEVIIPNQVLTARWSKGQGVGYDIGLDGVQFVGDPANIVALLGQAATLQQPITAGVMDELLAAFPDVDIWYSTEGTLGPVDAPGFLDGDLLSVRYGTIVASNDQVLPPSVPAGVPVRGVDFGLDAVAGNRTTDRSRLHFSTEILFEGARLSFTDGDVLLHALCDALLGAAALGDIGKHFPDTDEAYRGADSRKLLRQVYAKLASHGFTLVNADMTLIAQVPRLAPHTDAMRGNIAEDLQVAVDRISVKATTTTR